VSQLLAERSAIWLARRTTRRSFLVRMTMGATALAVAPLQFILRPGTAYAVVCEQCGGGPCCDGYTEFCCVLNGQNACPPGDFSGGWWKADGSAYCGGGPRYYVDCHAPCTHCGCSNGPFCGPECVDCGCGCPSCANRRQCCANFRYGQCHQEIACAGPITCRVASCDPPYVWDNSCAATSATDNATLTHTAGCLSQPAYTQGDGDLTPDQNQALGRIDGKTDAIVAAVSVDNKDGLVQRINNIEASVARQEKFLAEFARSQNMTYPTQPMAGPPPAP